ncbi:hypothetical protein IFM89_034746 [Coptis chinensis]|uniref:MORF/ORRM1/DAG-like MORF domain-containing protein n=1 Tax=Coptis chinensis TaxID=261450 RepID=A0A835HDA0_9MAGN|nr:hypothetical protein IFM89_034746 [Coptis chinensis]
MNDLRSLELCIGMLAKVIGIEEEARRKIYVVWCKIPFGFPAEIDGETSNKLKNLEDVLTLLPDYAHDVQKQDRGILVFPLLEFGPNLTGSSD